MRPMLATPSARVPSGDQWQHEVKWDGMRVLADVHDGRVRLTSRTEREVSVAFPELLTDAAGLTEYDDLLLDGEIVSLRDGRPSFGALAERFNVGDARTAATLAVQAPVTLMAFDVLRVAGTPTLTRPLSQRRELLEGIGIATARVQVPPTFPGGADLLRATADQGLEGIVSKRTDSAYLPGSRSPQWRKIVHRTTGSYVIGGWRPETDSARLGALLVGTPTPSGLAFRGRIGSGLAGAAGARLLEQLRSRSRSDSPFLERVPAIDAKGCTWVDPDLVADLEYHGVSEGGRLRQPTWRGLRPDLTPAELMDTAVEDPADA
ncbi:non-homologous end-joining DNA ligase [Allobranchiibius sp. CTAmp26]|uniref:non-homologous end-joining DNA ligase n=1 Tax=Allobranchiibius sp. CTAmp26 TaxID=2815214 RepID=UPI001AA15CF0|nr:non-homologous end-joining DNA ligase [Allobranchiibius sp. CTAmp26]MBO1753685.1 non-homologous end-joining DNA ligase [Allobranchiibius sp. CTAmp26]